MCLSTLENGPASVTCALRCLVTHLHDSPEGATPRVPLVPHHLRDQFQISGTARHTTEFPFLLSSKHFVGMFVLSSNLKVGIFLCAFCLFAVTQIVGFVFVRIYLAV